MTVKLDWPPEMESRLRGEARDRGLTLDAYLLEAVQTRTAGGAAPEVSRDELIRPTREEAGRSIRALRRDNFLGPELIEEGRRF